MVALRFKLPMSAFVLAISDEKLLCTMSTSIGLCSGTSFLEIKNKLLSDFLLFTTYSARRHKNQVYIAIEGAALVKLCPLA